MMMPAPPAADLVVVEPDLPFRLLEAGLDRPAARRDLAEQEQRHSWWSVGQIEFELAAIGVAAEDGGHLATKDASPEVADLVLRKLVDAWALGPRANGQGVPPVSRQSRGHRADGCRPPQVIPLAPAPGHRRRLRGHTGDRADAGRRRHFEEIPEAVAVERIAKARIAPVDLITGHPARLEGAAASGLAHHRERQGWLGREADLVRHAGRPTPLRVIGPLLRPIQPGIDQGAPARRRVPQKHADLAV